MNQPEALSVFCRLLRILCRSLPRYLEAARPWSRRDDEQAQEVLAKIVADQRTLAERVARAIVAHGGRPDPGCFPIEFTAINDLALDFLQQRLVECQRRDVAAIEHCAAELQPVPALRSLAEKALASARTHLDRLEDLTKHARL